jgi:hypothetical protein
MASSGTNNSTKMPPSPKKDDDVFEATKRVWELIQKKDVETKQFRNAFKQFFDLLTEDVIYESKDVALLNQWFDILYGDGPGMQSENWLSENEDLVAERMGFIEQRLEELEEEEEA